MNRSHHASSLDAQILTPGTHLTTARLGYRHHGLYAGDGKVLHYGGLHRYLWRRPVEEVSLARFARGRGFAVVAAGAARFAGSRGRRARSLALGRRPLSPVVEQLRALRHLGAEQYAAQRAGRDLARAPACRARRADLDAEAIGAASARRGRATALKRGLDQPARVRRAPNRAAGAGLVADQRGDRPHAGDRIRRCRARLRIRPLTMSSSAASAPSEKLWLAACQASATTDQARLRRRMRPQRRARRQRQVDVQDGPPVRSSAARHERPARSRLRCAVRRRRAPRAQVGQAAMQAQIRHVEPVCAVQGHCALARNDASSTSAR